MTSYDIPLYAPTADDVLQVIGAEHPQTVGDIVFEIARCILESCPGSVAEARKMVSSHRVEKLLKILVAERRVVAREGSGWGGDVLHGPISAKKLRTIYFASAEYAARLAEERHELRMKHLQQDAAKQATAALIAAHPDEYDTHLQAAMADLTRQENQ